MTAVNIHIQNHRALRWPLKGAFPKVVLPDHNPVDIGRTNLIPLHRKMDWDQESTPTLPDQLIAESPSTNSCKEVHSRAGLRPITMQRDTPTDSNLELQTSGKMENTGVPSSNSISRGVPVVKGTVQGQYASSNTKQAVQNLTMKASYLAVPSTVLGKTWLISSATLTKEDPGSPSAYHRMASRAADFSHLQKEIHQAPHRAEHIHQKRPWLISYPTGKQMLPRDGSSPNICV